MRLRIVLRLTVENSNRAMLCSSLPKVLPLWCGVEMYTVPNREATTMPKNFKANIVISLYETLSQFPSRVPINLGQN